MNTNDIKNGSQEKQEYELTESHVLPLELAHLLQRPIEENWELLEGIAYRPVESMKYATKLQKYITKTKKNYPKLHFITRPDYLLLKENDELIENTVLRPHLGVLTHIEEIQKNVFNGDVKLLVAITNRESEIRDNIQKLMACEIADVENFWIVNPIEEQVFLHTKNNEKRYNLPLIMNIDQDCNLPSTELSINFSKILM